MNKQSVIWVDLFNLQIHFISKVKKMHSVMRALLFVLRDIRGNENMLGNIGELFVNCM